MGDSFFRLHAIRRSKTPASQVAWVPGCSCLLYDSTYIPVLSLTSNTTMVRPFLAAYQKFPPPVRSRAASSADAAGLPAEGAWGGAGPQSASIQAGGGAFGGEGTRICTKSGTGLNQVGMGCRATLGG